MAIPLGTLMAQNDATHLYIGIDATSQAGVANINDYFQFIVDVNGNGLIDANRDKAFGIIQGQLNTLTMVYMLGPSTETGVPPGQVIASKLQSGFGPSLHSATPHRQWQVSFDLSELGIDPIDPTGPSPIIDFGLLIGSIGGVQDAMPANVMTSFANLNSIVLACAPHALVPAGIGPVISAIGLIGTGQIASDGYATIPAPYYITPDHASFCGTLNFIGNIASLETLWNGGVAKKYKVLHRYGATLAAANSAAWSPILQAWSNYQVVGPNDVLQSFGPDASGFYSFINPITPYTIQSLLFQWATSSEPEGVHQFQFVFCKATGVALTAAQLQGVTSPVITLALDNQAPNVDLISILHAGSVVQPCQIINLTSATDGVQLQFEAFDPEGDLLAISLTAEWGHGNVSNPPIYTDSYSAHASPTHIWQGVTSLTVPVSPAVWVPPTSCAYLFRVGATTRSTNGYSYPIIYATDFQTVTIQKPGSPVIKAVKSLPVAHLALAGPKMS